MRSKSRGKPSGKTDKTCWVCGAEGHWKRDCPERKKGSSHQRSSNSANVAANLPGPMALTASLFVSEEEWVLDSGCTFHITPRKEILTDLVEFEGNKMMMGNNSFCIVRGIGKITIRQQRWLSGDSQQRQVHARDGQKPDIIWTTGAVGVQLRGK